MASDIAPLKPVEFHVLLVLTDAPLHGYGIVKAIGEATGGRLRVEPGNLYRHIRRLEERGLVAPEVDVEDGADERRNYYRITPEGRRALTNDASRMRSLVAAVEARLGPPPT